MHSHHRRQFLAEVGGGMLLASIGPALAADLGLVSARAAEPGERIRCGALEPLVELMEQTPLERLLPALAQKLKDGVDLRTLTAAGALANARVFGGADYEGYHTFMALAPALEMARELPTELQALPVLKVLHRNTKRMQRKHGGHALQPITPASLPPGSQGGELIRAATRRGDIDQADRVFTALIDADRGEAFNHLQYAIQDEVDVHRTVLAWRAWTMLDIAGPEHAQLLLRQTIHHCVCEGEGIGTVPHRPGAIRTALVKLLDQYQLLGKSLGTRPPEDAWVDRLALTIMRGTPDQGGDAAAAALAEGFAPEAIGEAISLAANQLLLREGGSGAGNPNKPVGSVHGASTGVHASDAANGWRNIARVSNARNTVASLIVGAYHTGGQSGWSGTPSVPLPTSDDLAGVTLKEPGDLLAGLGNAIRTRDQRRACAIVQKYAETGEPARRVFDVLLRYGVSEDGAYHAEKYYRTVVEEFAATRPAFRWRHLQGLARVTASEFGKKADGYLEACRVLSVKG